MNLNILFKQENPVVPHLPYTFPQEGERVLALYKGEWIVLEVGVESPTFEESFQPFKYWFEPFSDALDIDAYDVETWVPLPEVPEKKQFVMFDIVKGEPKNVIIRDGVRPEKIYPHWVDDYGDKRDRWMSYEDWKRLIE